MKVFPDLILSWPKEVGGRSGFWVLFTLGLAALEVLGRFSNNDFEDGIAAGGLCLLILALVFRDGRRSRKLLISARNRIRTKAIQIAEKWSELEADLRRVPELERGLPPAQWKPAAWILGAVPVLYLYAFVIPVDLRSGISDLFYVGYLSLLVLLWAMMLSCGVITVLFSLTLLREFEAQRQNERRAASFRSWAGPTALMIAAVFGFVLVPTWAPWVSASAWLLTMALLLLPGGPKLDFAWKTDDQPSVRRVSDWSGFLALHSSILVGLPLVVALLGGGPALIEGWGSAVFQGMPVTSFFGIALAWVAAATAVLWSSVVARLVWPGRRNDPSKPCPTTIVCRNQSDLPSREIDMAMSLIGCKFRRDDRARQPDEVELVLVDQSEDFAFQETWPLRVSAVDCQLPALRERVLRRSQILRRRAFFKSLEKIWKSVPAAALEEGEGVLLAPHHWFSPGLTRDEGRDHMDEDKLTLRSVTLGPEYRKAMPLSARHHLYECLQALEIDVIYVERGIQYRHLRRALRIVFDVYDMHGGERGLDERDLVGIPGLRAVLHIFDFDEPFSSKVYPEPHYDGVGRARVLHLFRDRGEDESTVDDPIEHRGRPVPLLFG